MDASKFTIPAFTAKQLMAFEAMRTHKFTLFGGAAGGGKSRWLRWALFVFLLKIFRVNGLKSVVAGLFCEDYPALEDRQMRRIREEMVIPGVSEWNAARHELKLSEDLGGGIIACRNLDDPSKYASAEFGIIGLDELTKNKREIFDNLIWRIRWPGIDYMRFIGATNPGGIGAGWVKKFWVDKDFRNEPSELRAEDFAYVPAKASDNPYLPQSYFQGLAMLPEHLKKAYMDGSWDIIEGMYFTSWDSKIHVVQPWRVQDGITDKWGIPLSWQRVGGVDWGRAVPWAALVAAIDPDGRLIVYAGVAEAGWEHDRQADWMMQFPGVTWYVDDSCFFKGAGNSKESRAIDVSHVELWQKTAKGRLNIMPARKGNRVAGWNHLDMFLRRMPKIKEKPSDPDELQDRAWIEFFDVPGLRGDHGVITTLPKMIHDPNKPEDLDTTGDDHATECLRYLCLSRPQPAAAPIKLDRPWAREDYHGGYNREEPEQESSYGPKEPIASKW